MTTLTDAPPRSGRLRAAWTSGHAPVPGVSRWVVTAAYLVPFTVLPSSLWRIAAVTFHAPLGMPAVPEGVQDGTLPMWLPSELYVIILSIVSELLAFTAVGLVAGWGERVPRWIPGVGGRRVPPLAAIIPAVIGSATLIVLWTTVAVQAVAGRTVRGDPLPPENPLATHDWHTVLLAVSYAPLLLWGPLLGMVTVAYWRRRRGRPA